MLEIGDNTKFTEATLVDSDLISNSFHSRDYAYLSTVLSRGHFEPEPNPKQKQQDFSKKIEKKCIAQKGEIEKL